MLFDLAMLVLAISVLSLAELERREARMRAGSPAWGDLARITGVADPRELVRLPGVSLAGDGSLRFDPALRPALPVHVTGSLVDHRVGHGLSLSLSLAALGILLGGAALPIVGALLLGGAAGYQLLTRLYALVVWVEGRTGS
jgi:hypothetical protein